MTTYEFRCITCRGRYWLQLDFHVRELCVRSFERTDFSTSLTERQLPVLSCQ